MSVIVAARRTAVAPAGGAFVALSFHALSTPVILACLSDAGLDAAQVDEVIVGNALGAGGNPARLCALAADLPEAVAGLSIDRQCVSGLDAILLADTLIAAGRAEVVIAGGTESTSRRPLRLRTFPDGRSPEAYDQAAFTPWPDRDPAMAQAADRLARALGITRAAQDDWAVQSHAKTRTAGPAAEVVALAGLTQDAFTRVLTARTCARARVLAGDVTAANTAVAADAAAFVVVVSARIAKRLARPQARIVGGRTLGGQPDLPGLAPIAAARRALQDAQLTADDLAVAEIMEAYAVQAIACVQGIGLDPARVNIGGGALARGHPIGASGAINAVRLFHTLQSRGGNGLAAIAAAGGIGTALLLRV
ncbi:acetyl-CoA C-acyltransferase [Loktanella sp. DJP18]|uniref:acetyl-CoA C-acyltransferase n=1 Tax=Loktanella sp. DJP18 TaxID=3409788 RepID=UPI003BB57597